MIKNVAIIGGGPAGCALACFLAERSIECMIFDDNKRPALIVGESLIPAAIPIIRRLGIEQEIAKFSELKKGAGLRHGSGSPRVDFEFQKSANGTPDYAYNIPRAQFDAVLRKRAQTLGVRFIEHRAKVVATKDNSERDIQLSDESLAVAGLSRARQPDLLIDATGRKRLFSKFLGIEADRGPRNDIAHFAHFENYESDSAIPGQIVISVLDCGWSWQIPLPGRTSVGVVFNNSAAQSYGNTAAERLENVMQHNPVLSKQGFKRASEVMTYSNYQLLSKRGYGKGWILLGDAFGFVDPMLSPGVFMSLESARLLDERVFKNRASTQPQLELQLDQYVQEMRQWHKAWSFLIEHFYDGRILTLGEMRPRIDDTTPWYSFGRLADRFIGGLLSRLISGAGTRSKFSQAMLTYTCQFMLRNPDKLNNYKVSSDKPKSSTGPSIAEPANTNIAEYSDEVAKIVAEKVAV